MIIRGNASAIPLADSCVQCVVTSPPYWRLRDYGYEGQIGQEPTPQGYISNLMGVFNDVWRVLRDDGTLWLNLGDCYGRDKNLIGIPWRVAFALQDSGWILRSEIIWSKPNAMPSSVKDRPASTHETLFLFSKSEKYYYDHKAVQEDAVSTSVRKFTDGGRDKQRGHSRVHAGFNGPYAERIKREGVPKKRTLRDVWTVATSRFSEAHFATFPPKLVTPCILAGCPEGEIVLDPFAGSGTTVMVAQDLGRKGIGVELSGEYAPMAKRRTAQLALC